MYERQLIFNCIDLFASNSKTKFYEKIFDVIDLSSFPRYLPSKFGPKGYNRHALFRLVIVMKLEKYCEITEFNNFLDTNPYMPISAALSSLSLYLLTLFQRFIKNVDNSV